MFRQQGLTLREVPLSLRLTSQSDPPDGPTVSGGGGLFRAPRSRRGSAASSSVPLPEAVRGLGRLWPPGYGELGVVFGEECADEAQEPLWSPSLGLSGKQWLAVASWEVLCGPCNPLVYCVCVSLSNFTLWGASVLCVDSSGCV